MLFSVQQASLSISITLSCSVSVVPLEDCANCTGTGLWDCLWRGPRVILLSGWRILQRTTRMLRKESMCLMLDWMERGQLMYERKFMVQLW